MKPMNNDDVKAHLRAKVERNRKHTAPCRCAAYAFPHRANAGKCQSEQETQHRRRDEWLATCTPAEYRADMEGEL